MKDATYTIRKYGKKPKVCQVIKALPTNSNFDHKVHKTQGTGNAKHEFRYSNFEFFEFETEGIPKQELLKEPRRD